MIRVSKQETVIAEYIYDEAGYRLVKEDGGQKTYYVFGQNGEVIYEQEDKDYMEYIYVGNRHFARVDGNLDTEERATYFYHTDHLGSTVLVTDEVGETVWSTDYTPFGQVTFEEGLMGSRPNKFAKFTGKDLDEDTGLYYFNARWYDSEIGRFISEDPITDQYTEKLCKSYKKYYEYVEQQTKQGNKEDGKANISYFDYLLDGKELQIFVYDELSENAINLYRYCYNNPLIFVDLDGNKAYGVTFGGSAYLLVGAKGSGAWVWDDYGNYGVLVTGGTGFGAEVSTSLVKGLKTALKPGLGLTFNDTDTIYDLRGYDGMETSASFFVSGTFDEKGEFSGISGLGIGGSISWGYSVLIPVSDGVDFGKEILGKYVDWMREQNNSGFNQLEYLILLDKDMNYLMDIIEDICQVQFSV